MMKWKSLFLLNRSLALTGRYKYPARFSIFLVASLIPFLWGVQVQAETNFSLDGGMQALGGYYGTLSDSVSGASTAFSVLPVSVIPFFGGNLETSPPSLRGVQIGFRLGVSILPSTGAPSTLHFPFQGILGWKSSGSVQPFVQLLAGINAIVPGVTTTTSSSLEMTFPSLIIGPCLTPRVGIDFKLGQGQGVVALLGLSSAYQYTVMPYSIRYTVKSGSSATSTGTLSGSLLGGQLVVALRLGFQFGSTQASAPSQGQSEGVLPVTPVAPQVVPAASGTKESQKNPAEDLPEDKPAPEGSRESRAPSSLSNADRDSVEVRLKKLKALKESGVITPKEYKLKRAEVLKDL